MDKPKINTELLRNIMQSNGDTNATLAKALGIKSETVISRKINNWRDVRFNKLELDFIAVRYSLTQESAAAVFGELYDYYGRTYDYKQY